MTKGLHTEIEQLQDRPKDRPNSSKENGNV